MKTSNTVLSHKLKEVFIILFIFCFYSNLSSQEIEKSDIKLGETLTFTSNILGEQRKLNIYTPPSYGKVDKKYPVIYVLDGSLDEDFIHITGLTQFSSFSWINTIKESIVVGISNVDRKKDFTYPTNNKKDLEEFPTAGHSKNFISFLKKEVIPIIDKTYQTSTNKTLIGQSLGGLLASEILYNHTSLFNKYIIVSPSLWWDDESLLASEVDFALPHPQVYIAVGKEGPTMETTATKLYYKTWLLLNRKNVYYDFLEEANHGDALHLAVYNAFKKFKEVEEQQKK